MSLFKIDDEKCSKDGVCVKACPVHLIKMKEQGPVPVRGAEKFCIRCGHCVAACPEGAFSLNFLSPDQCMPIKKELELTAEHAEHFLRSRRSVRRYRDQPVPKDVFEKALAVACCAPTAANQQTVKWLVFDKKADVQKIASHVVDWMRDVVKTRPKFAQLLSLEVVISEWDRGTDKICRNAPQMVFAHASDAFGFAAADCHTALAYLELVLPAFGLGSCWAGYVTYAVNQWPPLAAELNLPENHTCHGALMVGTPELKYPRAPKRKAPDIRYHG